MALAQDRGRRRSGGWLFDQPYLLLALTSLFWAGNTILGRFIVGHVPPMTLAFIRWTGATVILLPFAMRHLARDWPVIRQHAGLMTLLALTGFSVYNTLSYYGLQYTTAINGLLLQSVAPLFVAMWTFALFGERLTLRQACGICVSQCCLRSRSTAAMSASSWRWSFTASTQRICASGRRSIRSRFWSSAWAAARSF